MRKTRYYSYTESLATILKITNYILKILIVIGLTLSIFNTGLFLIREKTFIGFSFERKLFWTTFLLCFFAILSNVHSDFKNRFYFISIIVLVITQFTIIGESGLINSNTEIRLNDKYVLKTGTTLITVPSASIYRTESFFEKEVTKRGGVMFDPNRIDSIRVKNIDKYKIVLNFFLNDSIQSVNFEWKKQ